MKQRRALGEIEAGGADVAAGGDRLADDDGIAVGLGILLDQDGVGAGRNRRAGEDADGLAGPDDLRRSRAPAAEVPTTRRRAGTVATSAARTA